MSEVTVGFIGASSALSARRVATRLVYVAAISLTIVASALPAGATGSATGHAVAPFHMVRAANGATSTNVCSYATAPGFAHCNVTRRIDDADESINGSDPSRRTNPP